jgi:hypothetical protein
MAGSAADARGKAPRTVAGSDEWGGGNVAGRKVAAVGSSDSAGDGRREGAPVTLAGGRGAVGERTVFGAGRLAPTEVPQAGQTAASSGSAEEHTAHTRTKTAFFESVSTV